MTALCPSGTSPAVRVRVIAAEAADWPALAAAARDCTACAELVANRRQVVVGEAPVGARLMLVGEAPGATEDATGRPFVGKAGALLDDVLAEAGISRPAVAVVNVLKCRPPGNRRPRPPEVERCRGWLDRQLDLVDPVLVVTLGTTAAAAFFGRAVRLSELRGRVHERGGRRLVVTYHPSAAIRLGPNGAPRAALRADLALAAAWLSARP